MKKIATALSLTALLFLNMSFMPSKEWYLMDTKEFSLTFPEKPTNQQQTAPSAIGNLEMDINMYDASKVKGEENMIYGLITTVYPDSLIDSDKPEIFPAFWRNSTDGAVNNVKGKLISEKNLTIGGFPAYEIRIDYQNGLAVIVMRSILVHNKMYVLQTIAEKARDNNKPSHRFFDSFTLK